MPSSEGLQFGVQRRLGCLLALLVKSCRCIGFGLALECPSKKPIESFRTRVKFVFAAKIVNMRENPPVDLKLGLCLASHFFFHRAAAALRAISERCSGVSFFRRAAALSLPPLEPSVLKYSSRAGGSFFFIRYKLNPLRKHSARTFFLTFVSFRFTMPKGVKYTSEQHSRRLPANFTGR